MTHPVAPRYQAVDLAAARQRLQDAGENLDGGGFARAVRADEAHQLAAFEGKTYSLEGFDGAIAAMEQSGERAQRAGFAFGNAIRFRQILDKNLRHDHPSRRCFRETAKAIEAIGVNQDPQPDYRSSLGMTRDEERRRRRGVRSEDLTDMKPLGYISAVTSTVEETSDETLLFSVTQSAEGPLRDARDETGLRDRSGRSDKARTA